MVTIPTIDQISGTTVMNKMRSLIHAFINFATDVVSTFTNYYTKDEVDELLEDLPLPVLDNYYTKTEVNALIAEVEAEIPSTTNFATKSWVYDTCYTRTQIDNYFRNYYTISEVDALIAQIPAPDMSNYYTKTEVNNLIDDFITSADANSIALNVVSTSLISYYTKTEVDALIPDMTNYYNKSQVDALIPDMTNYYTKSQVDALIPNMSNYYTKTEVYTKSEVDALISGGSSGYYNWSELTDKSSVILESAAGVRIIKTIRISFEKYTSMQVGYNSGTCVFEYIIPKGTFLPKGSGSNRFDAYFLTSGNFYYVNTSAISLTRYFLLVSDIVDTTRTNFVVRESSNTITLTENSGVYSFYNSNGANIITPVVYYDPNEPAWVQS